MKCGRCGHALSYVHHKFRAPPARDQRSWSVIEYLESVGQIRMLNRGDIPKTMREAKLVVAKQLEQEIAESSDHLRLQKNQRHRRRLEIDQKRRLAENRRRWARLARSGRAL